MSHGSYRKSASEVTGVMSCWERSANVVAASHMCFLQNFECVILVTMFYFLLKTEINVNGMMGNGENARDVT